MNSELEDDGEDGVCGRTAKFERGDKGGEDAVRGEFGWKGRC